MGVMHDSKPEMPYDKTMSVRHKSHRREIDAMKDGEKKLKKSIKYNMAHAKEHVKALKESRKRLKKMGH
jgi:hypothetical protein